MSRRVELIVILVLFLGVFCSPHLLVLLPRGLFDPLMSVLFFDLGGEKSGFGALTLVFSIWSRIFAIIGFILTTYLILSEKNEALDASSMQMATVTVDNIVSAELEEKVKMIEALPVVMTYKGVNAYRGKDSYHIIVNGSAIAIDAEYNIKPTIDYWLGKVQS